ncbi:hypothetical protein O6H91_10G012800 [Diphasiastrum complanatum]|uniref:Uncharacterized protein n=1 Tax=Diphasiastrum complanatum TaxID=34168 RepID=A0ACC2CEF0_DIPCM|nr:hypothetical protein O6H91_10G012800 [Diphasiastrum complanatum]
MRVLHCRVVKRRKVYVLRNSNPKHKHRQGFCTLAYQPQPAMLRERERERGNRSRDSPLPVAIHNDKESACD